MSSGLFSQPSGLFSILTYLYCSQDLNYETLTSLRFRGAGGIPGFLVHLVKNI